MTRAFAPALALFCAACSSLDGRHVGPLLDRMEQQLQLPKAARPLSAYARYYARSPRGEIEALYILPVAGVGCEAMGVAQQSQRRPCLEILNGPKAGERRWVKDASDFPVEFDGGCSVIRLVFEPVTAMAKTIRCNGVG